VVAGSNPVSPTRSPAVLPVSLGGAPLALLPIGSFEQHGPYLPLVTDTLIATVISESISRHHNTFQLPALAFGCSHEHAGFRGTVSISAVTLNNIVSEVVDSLRSQGVLGLIIVNAHGGNYVLSNAVQEANAQGQVRVGLFPSREDWREVREAADITSTTTCMRASSKRRSCSPHTPDTSAMAGRRPTTARQTADTSQLSA
jgi:creatinine amidohydrolase/Fe(II)-dependent formamide hydrolase-like protein